jgi:hypothetical protein
VHGAVESRRIDLLSAGGDDEDPAALVCAGGARRWAWSYWYVTEYPFGLFVEPHLVLLRASFTGLPVLEPLHRCVLFSGNYYNVGGLAVLLGDGGAMQVLRVLSLLVCSYTAMALVWVGKGARCRACGAFGFRAVASLVEKNQSGVCCFW